MSFEAFSPIYGPMLLKSKNIRKKSKMQNFEKKKWSGDMVKRYLFHQNLALICLTGSEKTGFTDDGRTDDGRLSDDSSSAVQWHKAVLKKQHCRL